MKPTQTQESGQDRDARLEESYHFHRATPYESLTAHVSTNREALALAFFDWATKQPFQSGDDEMLVRFEEDRFGRALEPVAHGMLGFSVKHQREHLRPPIDAQFRSEEQRAMVESAALALPAIEGEGMEAKLQRLAIASGLMLPEQKPKPLARVLRSMPGAPLPVEQREVRLPYRDDADEPPRPVAIAAAPAPEPEPDPDPEPAEPEVIDWSEDEDPDA